ncbi:MAG: hypothetical protein ACKO0W_09615 [Planctomycetota bacterium]
MKNMLPIMCVAAVCSAAGAGATCEGDVNGDTNVGLEDLVAVLQDWGCMKGCDGDATGDGMVNQFDLLAVLSNWGPCNDGSGCTTMADCDDGDPCTIDFCLGGNCFHLPAGPGCQ